MPFSGIKIALQIKTPFSFKVIAMSHPLAFMFQFYYDLIKLFMQSLLSSKLLTWWPCCRNLAVHNP